MLLNILAFCTKHYAKFWTYVILFNVLNFLRDKDRCDPSERLSHLICPRWWGGLNSVSDPPRSRPTSFITMICYYCLCMSFFGKWRDWPRMASKASTPLIKKRKMLSPAVLEIWFLCEITRTLLPKYNSAMTTGHIPTQNVYIQRPGAC